MGAIDVVMPAAPKDFPVLRRAVRGALRHLEDVRHVHVVSAAPFRHRSDRVRWVAEPAGGPVPGLDEIRRSWPAGSAESPARAGWIYQQLLKLGAARYIEGLSPSFLVVDSDVVFLRPVSFSLEGVRFPYSRATEYHEPYRDAYRRLLGDEPPSGYSFVAHHMLFDQELLDELLREIEARHGKPWHEAILDAVDFDKQSSFSEWDLYGHWVVSRHPELARHRQLLWRDVGLPPGPVGRAVLGLDYDFVAAHAWARQQRWRRGASAGLRIAGELRATLTGH